MVMLRLTLITWEHEAHYIELLPGQSTFRRFICDLAILRSRTGPFAHKSLYVDAWSLVTTEIGGGSVV